MKDTSVIPVGMYCYGVPKSDYEAMFDKENHRIDLTGKSKICPYWSLNQEHPHQLNGYCGFLGEGDWEQEGFGLLWDQCKECGVDRDACDHCGKVTDDLNVVDLNSPWNYLGLFCDQCKEEQ